ncbi:MAG: NAD(P)-binding domain-containing protein [Phycisphaeraceae bacterium]|nr:NAD(P)-binding domain-containing protein [Phycisphaeraceae bacterium]
MINPLTAYTRWLHTRWPADKPERLPVVEPDGTTNVRGLYVVGDLTGVPLLKFSADTGARAVQHLLDDNAFNRRHQEEDVLDLAIIGGGVAGHAAAIEAAKAGLDYRIYEASEPFSTIVNFPREKPIYTYPEEMEPAGEIHYSEKSDVKEGLLEELREIAGEYDIEPVSARIEAVRRAGGGVHELVSAEGENIRAHRVIVAIGRSGNFRRLDVPGEDLDKVSNRLHDPKDFCDQQVLVVGGGDSALETAIALATCGAEVTLSYRKPEFSRPKPETIEKIKALAALGSDHRAPDVDLDVETVEGDRVTTPSGDFLGERDEIGSVRLAMPTEVTEIREDEVDLVTDGEVETIANDTVFTMIGREAPLDFFRKSGVRIRGERTVGWWASLLMFLTFCTWLYHWKSDTPLLGIDGLGLPDWLVWDPAATWSAISASLPEAVGAYLADPATLGGTIAASMHSRSFYYTLAYCLCVVIFGIGRMRRRPTPYVRVQTLTLMAIQVIPLFLLPEILLPWMSENGWFDGGAMGWLADQIFPNQSWWRAYGLILAWPLMAWNLFTAEPIWAWVILGFVQTFILIPWLVYFRGKGAYCGWICSCGALAETMGDRHRHKMPHGPGWNRLNMIGQVLLGLALLIQGLFVLRWVGVGWATTASDALASGLPAVSWAWLVDILWAGILGVGLYFWFSGRVWCRFACPLAALMHIYHRFGRFAILAEKKKCISCNVCTSVCHQGIDVMNFANKGLPMKDPQCVRCSACVQECPTGVLSFGQVDGDGRVIAEDRLAASPVRMGRAELTVEGKKPT